MSLTHPIEIIGQSISCWDEFYKNNYDWLFKTSLQNTGNERNAQDFTERILLNVLLKHPELVVSQNTEQFKAHIYLAFPQMFSLNKQEGEAHSKALLRKYYCQN